MTIFVIIILKILCGAMSFLGLWLLQRGLDEVHVKSKHERDYPTYKVMLWFIIAQLGLLMIPTGFVLILLPFKI